MFTSVWCDDKIMSDDNQSIAIVLMSASPVANVVRMDMAVMLTW